MKDSKMKTRKVLTVALFCVAVAGFARDGFGGELIDKVIGVWNYQTKTPYKDVTQDNFLEFSKDAVTHTWSTGQDGFDPAFDEKDGRVVVRIAGTDNIAHVIKFIDSDTIETTLQGMRGATTLKRATAEARDAGLKKNKEAIEASVEWVVDDSGALTWGDEKSYALYKDSAEGREKYGIIQEDGSVISTRTREPRGHINDYIPGWKPEPIADEYSYPGSGQILIKNFQPFGLIQEDGTVISHESQKPVGHITDYIPDWKP